MFEPMFYRSNWLNLRSSGVKWCFATSFLLIALFLTFPQNVLASWFDETFENYNLGNLNGQGDWVCTGNLGQVNTNQHYSGFKSLNVDNVPSNDCRKTSASVSDGNNTNFSFYFKATGSTKLNDFRIARYGSLAVWLRIDCTSDPCDIEQNSTGSWLDTGLTAPRDQWNKILINISIDNQNYRLKVNTGDFSDWFSFRYTNYEPLNFVFFAGYLGNNKLFLDNLLGFNESDLDIDFPPTESEIGEKFDLSGNYNKREENWNKVMIIFEQWNLSSTCPIDPDEVEAEQNKGWFIYQSFPYFSDYLLTEIGDFEMLIDDLRTGYYNCIRCYFINDNLGLISDEKCRGYRLNIIEGFTPYFPSYNFPFESWDAYYSQHSEKYPTSTPLFSTIAGALSPVAERIGNFVVYIKTYFDVEKASAKGTTMGQAIPVARGYLEEFNNFFGGLPISEFIIFYILSLSVVICYKVIYGVIRLLKI